MMTELVTVFLTKTAEFAYGKALDILWECSRCDQKTNWRIGNQQHNGFLCSNCSKEITQYTNANSNTVQTTGQISHVAVGFSSKWNYITDGIPLFRRNIGIQVPGTYLFQGLHGQPITEINEVIDQDTKAIYSRERNVWKPKSNLDRRDMWMNVYFSNLPQDKLQERNVYILETRMLDRFDNLLLQERDIVQL